MRRQDLAVDQEILRIWLATDPSVWTDVLMHDGHFGSPREPVCDDLRDGTRRHSQLSTKGLRNFP